MFLIQDGDLKVIFKTILNKMDDMESFMTFLAKKCVEVYEKLMVSDKKIERLEKTIKEKDVKINNLEHEVRELQQNYRKDTLEIHGVEAMKEENIYEIVTKAFKQWLPKFKESDIKWPRISRKINNTRTPVIIAQLDSRRTREKLFNAKKKLKNRFFS